MDFSDPSPQVPLFSQELMLQSAYASCMGNQEEADVGFG